MSQLLQRLEKHAPDAALALSVLVLVEALAASAIVGADLRFWDEMQYDGLAQRLLAGQGYVGTDGAPTAYRPPGYAFLLAALYAVADSLWAPRFANAVALALSAWLLSRLAASHSRLAAPLVPLGFLAYPLFAFAASTLYPQVTAMLLLALSLFLLRGRVHVSRCALAGVTYGTLILFVPLFTLLLPAFVIHIALERSVDRRPGWARGALFAAMVAAVLLPWTVRNAHTFGRFVFVSTNSGVVLLMGNSEQAGANTGVNADISRYTHELPPGASEIDLDTHYRRRALEWMAADPLEALWLYAAKTLNFFNFRNELATASEQRAWHDLLILATYYPLLGLALARALRHRSYPLSADERFLFVLYFGGALASAVFFTRIRFRIPFDAVLILLASIAASHFLSRTPAVGAPPSRR